MRIAKVALAFFSIGFLAGSFERAAGLADAEQSRSAHDRHADPGAAIVHSTKLAMAAIGPIGSGLPEELLARPLSPLGDKPDAVATALPALLTDPMLAGRSAFVRYAPEESTEANLTTVPSINPDLGRHSFGGKRMLSEPDLLPMSRMPDPKWMSVAPAEPSDPGPVPVPGGAERGTQNAVSQEFIMPFEKGRVTSLFNQGRYHPAIDLAGPLGSRVHATTRRQRVAATGRRGGYGNAVMTRDNLGRTHLYAHLQRITARVGALLDQGQQLGTLGSTGRSTGPHVHYEVRTRAGRHIDPVTLLFPGRRVGRGYAWNGSRTTVRVAALAAGQPRPR